MLLRAAAVRAVVAAAVAVGVVGAVGAVGGIGGIVADERVLEMLGWVLPRFLNDSMDDLVSAAAASCEMLPLKSLFSHKYSSETASVSVVEVTRWGRRRYRVQDAPRRLSGGVLRNTTLVLYVSGWLNTPDDESSETLMSALLQKHYVILILDTRDTFGRGYVTSASRVKGLAHTMFELIQNLNKEGIPLESLHLLGFSLGCHVAGITGRLVQKRFDRKLPKITALDPAKPCFGSLSKYRLSKNDAKFVQVLHTSGGIGTETPMGHLDVYVNGVGVTQPECARHLISLECDHAQAWRLYAASVVDPRRLVARRCAGWRDLQRRSCTGAEVVAGYGSDVGTQGLYLYRSPQDERNLDRRRESQSPFNIITSWFT